MSVWDLRWKIFIFEVHPNSYSCCSDKKNNEYLITQPDTNVNICLFLKFNVCFNWKWSISYSYKHERFFYCNSFQVKAYITLAMRVNCLKMIRRILLQTIGYIAYTPICRELLVETSSKFGCPSIYVLIIPKQVFSAN